MLGANPAAAVDDYPCGDPWRQEYYGYDVQTCPLWRDNVPVHVTADQSSRIVGYLEVGGSTNWFVHQTPSLDYQFPENPQVRNKWWARTVADNGNWGYVSEVYFAGGENDERDANLKCVSSFYGTC